MLVLRSGLIFVTKFSCKPLIPPYNLMNHYLKNKTFFFCLSVLKVLADFFSLTQMLTGKLTINCIKWTNTVQLKKKTWLQNERVNRRWPRNLLLYTYSCLVLASTRLFLIFANKINTLVSYRIVMVHFADEWLVGIHWDPLLPPELLQG